MLEILRKLELDMVCDEWSSLLSLVDNKGFGAGWYLDNVTITVDATTWEFPCDKWFDKDKGDKLIVRELLPKSSSATAKPTTDKIQQVTQPVKPDTIKTEVKATEVKTPDTKAQPPTTVKATEPPKAPEPVKASESKAAEPTKTPSAITQSHESIKSDTTVKATETVKPPEPSKAPDVKPSVDPKVQSLQPNASASRFYKIIVKTGNVSMAGTNANVSICLFGEKEDTGDIALKNGDKKNPFEQNQVDTFNITAKNIGDIKKIRIGHGKRWNLLTRVDNKGFGAGWYLEKVTITADTTTWEFPCNQWFDKDKGDKLIVRELLPKSPTAPDSANPIHQSAQTTETVKSTAESVTIPEPAKAPAEPVTPVPAKEETEQKQASETHTEQSTTEVVDMKHHETVETHQNDEQHTVQAKVDSPHVEEDVKGAETGAQHEAHEAVVSTNEVEVQKKDTKQAVEQQKQQEEAQKQLELQKQQEEEKRKDDLERKRLMELKKQEQQRLAEEEKQKAAVRVKQEQEEKEKRRKMEEEQLRMKQEELTQYEEKEANNGNHTTK